MGILVILKHALLQTQILSVCPIERGCSKISCFLWRVFACKLDSYLIIAFKKLGGKISNSRKRPGNTNFFAFFVHVCWWIKKMPVLVMSCFSHTFGIKNIDWGLGMGCSNVWCLYTYILWLKGLLTLGVWLY